MKLKLFFLLMVLLLATDLLMSAPVPPFENRKISDRTNMVWDADAVSVPYSFNKPIELRSLYGWDEDENDGLEGNDGIEGNEYNDSPVSDGVFIFVLLTLFYGIIMQQKNKSKKINK